MRLKLIFFFCCISYSLFSQVGRFEEPVDTIAIGGEVQENKSTQMEAQDDLTNALIAVRDSVKLIVPASLASQRRKEVDETITGLKKSDQTPQLMKKGYALLSDVRSEISSSQKASD